MPNLVRLLLSIGVYGYFTFVAGSKVVSVGNHMVSRLKPPEKSAYVMDTSKKLNGPKLIQTREFPMLWDVPTRTFDPTCLVQAVKHMSLEKQSAAVQAGYIAWHMLIAKVDFDDVQYWLEVQNEANQTVCFTLCLNHTERQRILSAVYDDVMAGDWVNPPR